MALGKHINAADNNHIIRPAKHSTFKHDKRPAAGAGLGPKLYQISSSVANDGTADPAEVRDHQLAFFACSRRFAGVRIDDFSDEFIFVDVDGAGLGLTLESESSHFGGARMIITFRPPGLFDQFFSAWNARAGLAGVDGDLYGGFFGEIHSGFSRFSRHMERVSRRADKHGGAVVGNRLQPLRRWIARRRKSPARRPFARPPNRPKNQ